MTAKNRWLLGLQWGACIWFPWLLWDAAIDFNGLLWDGWLKLHIAMWPAFWWTPAFGLLLPGWIATVVLIVVGSRRARPAVVTMLLLRVVLACVEAHGRQSGHDDAWLFLPPLVPVLPLVALRVEEPRVVLALAALGRWREAFARSGGGVALLVALAVLSTYHAAYQALGPCDLPTACAVTIIITALAAVVTLVTWATGKRRSSSTESLI